LRLLRSGRLGSHIDHLPGPRIVKLLARLFFDSPGIGLELVHLLGVLVIVFLQSTNFFFETLIFRALGPVNRKAVGAKHRMQKKPDSENGHGAGSEPAPDCIQGPKHGFESPMRLPRPGPCLSGAIAKSSEPLFGRWENPDFGNSYSNIHCLAAALTFSNSRALFASE
jgi:hypothetical protein